MYGKHSNVLFSPCILDHCTVHTVYTGWHITKGHAMKLATTTLENTSNDANRFLAELVKRPLHTALAKQNFHVTADSDRCCETESSKYAQKSTDTHTFKNHPYLLTGCLRQTDTWRLGRCCCSFVWDSADIKECVRKKSHRTPKVFSRHIESKNRTSGMPSKHHVQQTYPETMKDRHGVIYRQLRRLQ